MKNVIRNTSTPELKAFWDAAEKSAKGAEDWPDWKRAGINDAPMREEPRAVIPIKGR